MCVGNTKNIIAHEIPKEHRAGNLYNFCLAGFRLRGYNGSTISAAGWRNRKEINNVMDINNGMNRNGGMEWQAQTQFRANEIMKKYWVHTWISYAIVLLDIIFLIYMVVFKMDYRINYIIGGFAELLLIISVFALYGVIAAIAILVKWLGAVKIDMALYEECDPFVYEACLDRLHPLFYKERFAVLHAMARYYQGDEYTAEEILRNVNMYKLKGLYKLNYYILLSAISLKKGEGMRAAEFEKSYRRSLKKSKKEQIFFKILCASNNLNRAMENEDYQSAFRFLSERKVLDSGKCRKWTYIGYSLFEAKIYAGIGDEKSARLNLNYVISEGGRLVYVKRAGELLQKLDGNVADMELSNGEMENGELSNG